jgi:hypothetical protein
MKRRGIEGDDSKEQDSTEEGGGVEVEARGEYALSDGQWYLLVREMGLKFPISDDFKNEIVYYYEKSENFETIRFAGKSRCEACGTCILDMSDQKEKLYFESLGAMGVIVKKKKTEKVGSSDFFLGRPHKEFDDFVIYYTGRGEMPGETVIECEEDITVPLSYEKEVVSGAKLID